MHRLDYIDQLRGLAILMVMAVHESLAVQSLGPASKAALLFGQLGVQLFFIASAYTLCLTHLGKHRDHNSYRMFMVRRFFRIAPLYYLAIPIYGTLTWARYRAGFHVEHAYTLPNILANVLFIHGFYPPANNNIVVGGWSIGTEMAFYLIFPLLFIAFESTYLRFSLKGVAWLALTASFAILTGECGAVLLWNHPMENNTFWYFNLINQLPVFLLGMLAFYAIKRNVDAQPAAHILRDSMLFLALGAVACWLYWKNYAVSFIWVPAVAGAGFVFLLNTVRAFDMRSGLMGRIGRLSYSMYIFHNIFMFYLARYLVMHLMRDKLRGIPEFALLFLICGTVTLVVSHFSEMWIERRGIALGRFLNSRWSG